MNHKEIYRPAHYTQGKFECADIADDQDATRWGLQILKYWWRYRFKGHPIKDLMKCKWYIDREIKRLRTAGCKE